MTVGLMTSDERRADIATRSIRLVERCEVADPTTVRAMLWGARGVRGLSASDRRRAHRHRVFLEELVAAGLEREVIDELAGIESAFGLDEGRLNRAALSVAGLRAIA